MNCLICKNINLEFFYQFIDGSVIQNKFYDSLKDALGEEKVEVILYICKNCGFVFNADFNSRKIKYSSDYDNTQENSLYLEKYLSKYKGLLKNALKICEIGCGDGKLIKKLSNRFGYESFGIEYSKPAADEARKLGINVILGDVFDKSLLNKYSKFFDIVYSYGFIEHINFPEKAIEIHLLLKPGGYFFVQILRFKGFNYWKIKFFRPDLLSLHNLEIMEEEKLWALCDRPDIEELFCRNYGTFKLRVPMDKKI